MTEKALALVVRGTDWSETSRIVTLFTREFGKIRALAKGGRRLKSSFDVGFDLLTVCRVVFIRKASGGLDLLTEAHMAETFPALRTNLPGLYAGYYVAELLADGMQDYDPHESLFEIAMETLRALNRGTGESPVECISRFELAWLREIGYAPQFDACAVCDAEFPVPWPPAYRVVFSPGAGGAVCPGCSATVRDQRPLSTESWAVLRELSRRVEAFEHPLELTAVLRREVRAVLGWTVASVLGRRPRMLGYVDGG